MSPHQLSLPFTLKQFLFSHQESDGTDVYHSRNKESEFHLKSQTLLTTSLWTAAGPLEVRGNYVPSHAKGVFIDLEHQRHQVDITVQTDETPCWIANFNFGNFSTVVIPLFSQSKRPGSILRVNPVTSSKLEKQSAIASLTRSYHIIVVNHPHKAPAPKPNLVPHVIGHLAA